jgi:hypothetical protein
MRTISTPVVPWEISHVLNSIPSFIYALMVTVGVAMTIGIVIYYWDLKHRKPGKSNLGCY